MAESLADGQVGKKAPLDDAPLLRFHRKLAVYCASGPFLVGYLFASMTVALTQITPQLGLEPMERQWLSGSMLLGILIGGTAGGMAADHFGRQKVLRGMIAAIAVLALAQFWVESLFFLLPLRVLICIAAGATLAPATALLTEFIPKWYRGTFLGGLVVAGWTGAALACLVGDLFEQAGGQGWRWTLASAAIPAGITLLFGAGTPESPRWLASSGRFRQANAEVKDIFGPGIEVPGRSEQPPGGAQTLWAAGYTRRLSFIASIWMASVIPLGAAFAFAPDVLRALKLTGTQENMGRFAIVMLFLVGAAIGMSIVNGLGRRGMLIVSFQWSGLALLLLGVFPRSPGFILVGLFGAYALCIGGLQVLQWVYPNELFPTAIRASAVGYAVSLGMVGVALGLYAVPPTLKAIGVLPTVLAAVIVCFGGFALALARAPETRGRDLDSTTSLRGGIISRHG